MRISDWSSDVCSSDLDVGNLAAGGGRWRFGARHILGELGVDDLGARPPFRRLELEGAGAGVVLDLLEGVGLGDALGHDEGDVGGDLADRFQHQAVGHAQLHLEAALVDGGEGLRSEEHTSELQSLMRISYAVFCLKKKKNKE